MASARTYNDSGSGSYGQLIEGIAEADAIPAGRTARLVGLVESGRDDAGFRTNLGLVSVSGESMEVEVELRDGAASTLGTRVVVLEPWESVQLDRVFTAMTTEPIDAGLALVRTTTPSGRFFAYASVIDNRTIDPVYVLALYAARAELRPAAWAGNLSLSPVPSPRQFSTRAASREPDGWMVARYSTCWDRRAMSSG